MLRMGEELPAEEVTIWDTNQDKDEDEKEEECSRSKVHNGWGKADGDIAEIWGHVAGDLAIKNEYDACEACIQWCTLKLCIILLCL